MSMEIIIYSPWDALSPVAVACVSLFAHWDGLVEEEERRRGGEEERR